jgi:type IV pilus assembly protein PilA
VTTQNGDFKNQGGIGEFIIMTHNEKSQYHQANGHAASGFTLIELMIVIAIIAILLSLALPVYSTYSIRAKIAESLSVGNSAKTAVSASCQEDRTISSLSNSLAGYSFVAGSGDTDYVHSVQTSGSCVNPVITITSKNTGQSPAPIILLSGNFAVSGGRMKWICSSSNTPNWFLPKTCRS